MAIEAENASSRKFFELAERFRTATDPRKPERLGDELGPARMVFGR